MSARDQLNRYRAAVSTGMRDDEKEHLASIEAQIKKLESYQTLSQTPGIRDLLMWSKGAIIDINTRLSTDRDLQKDGQEATRLAMFDRKDVLLYFVGLFDPIADLEMLEKQLEIDAEEMEKYQEGRH